MRPVPVGACSRLPSATTWLKPASVRVKRSRLQDHHSIPMTLQFRLLWRGQLITQTSQHVHWRTRIAVSRFGHTMPRALTPGSSSQLLRLRQVRESPSSPELQQWERKMVLFGTVSSGQTTALPNGTHNIILASGTSQTQPTGFPVPTITTLAPSSLVAGAAPQTLTINGTNLLSSSTVTFNGVPHSPTYVNSSQLTIPLTSGDLAAAGSFPVVVANPGAIGTLSTAATFWVTTGATTGTVPVGSHPLALAVNPQTNKIYVTNYGSNSVTVIDGNDNSTATIALPYAPWALAVNAVTNKVYVSGGTEVTVIDGATNNTTSIPLAAAATNGGLYGIAVNAVTNKVYVSGGTEVTVIDGATNNTTSIPLAAAATNGGLYGIAVNALTNTIYVVDYYDDRSEEHT